MQFLPDPETTTILRGTENTIRGVVLFFKSASTVSAYADAAAPSIAIGVPSIKKCYEELKRRNAKIRWITEITKDNLHYCRALMEYAELRHLDRMKGNFGVSDTAYIATASVNKAQPFVELIYSTARSVIEQNKYVFDTLWSKAVVAEDRITEIENGGLRAETRVIKDPLKILEDTMGMVRRSNQYSICSVSDGLFYAHNHCLDVFREIFDRYKIGKHTGIRWLTNIEDNQDGQLLEIVKNFMNLGMSVRHAKAIPPISFGVTGKELGVTVEHMRDGSLNSSAIFSSEPAFVEQFTAIFEELWNRAVDAKDRIQEIESETKTFIDIIQNAQEIQKRYHELVASAREQVLLFLPTARAYRREEKIGIFKTLTEAAARGIDTKVLFPIDEKIEDKMQERTEIKQAIRIRNIKTDSPTEARSKILVVDKRHYLVVELKDDSKEGFAEAVGSAIFSNSKSTILSYLTMFDSLWRQSELYEKVEAHDKMQKEFINIAAHELRTPTQSILGFSELLQDNPGEGGDYMLKALTRNAYRLHTLITDILDASRIEGGTLKLNRENIHLVDLINTVIADVENQVKGSHKSIEIYHRSIQRAEEKNDDNNNPIIHADKDRISQVLSNLVDNALKFTKEGKIEVITEKKNNEIMVEVIDSGTGIDHEILPRLFEKFATKSEKGTGLGLFISKNIIEAHGGRIWAQNNDDRKGATFTFTIPMAT